MDLTSTTLPDDSFTQKWRLPISRGCAIVWLLIAVITVPRGFASGWHEAVEYLGFLLLIIAAQGRIWSMVYILGRKNREVCQTGPYSLTRNPLYFFSFLGVLGLSLALQHVLLGLIAAVCFLWYYAAVIRGEERILHALHGRVFETYRAQVPRFWPRFARPDAGGVSLVLHIGPFMRGLREVFWFLAVIILAEILEWAHIEQLWPSWQLPF